MSEASKPTISPEEYTQALEWARQEVDRPFDTRYPLISGALLAADYENEWLRKALQDGVRHGESGGIRAWCSLTLSHIPKRARR